MRHMLVVGTLYALLCIVSCGGIDDYSVPLPNGYFLERTNVDSVGIMGRDGEVIPPNIVEIAVTGGIVVGRVDCRDSWDTGYFVLDTRSGERSKGISQEELQKRLRTLGVEPVPTLRHPSALRHNG